MKNRRPLFFSKAFYFFYYGAWACLLPFLALYYKSLGFSGAQIGVLSSIAPFMTLMAAPLWGGVADALHRHKQILLVALAGAGLSVIGLSQVRGFGWIALLVGCYSVFSATIIPQVDNSVLALLGQQRDQYGKQRVWGAIGWGMAGPAVGALISQGGLGWSFAGYAMLVLLALLAAWRLPIHFKAQHDPFWSGVRKLVTDQRWFLFLLISFISGAGLSVISNYLFLYMNELNASSTIMGLALTMSTLSEIPVLFLSGKMLQRWGPRGLLVFSLIAFVIRAMLYTIATQPWQVLIIQLMHGLTFSTMWVAGVSFANQIAPEGLGATAQGLFTSTTMGVGGITGSLVGGLLLDRFGGHGMYFGMGIAVLFGLLLFVFLDRRTPVNTYAPLSDDGSAHR